jgi:hypothetical protein
MKLLFFALLFSLLGNDPSPNGISYRHLSWEDFRGQVSQNEPSVAARSMTQLSMEITETDGKANYRVIAYFLPDSSFVRVRSYQTLRHEQMHFLIAYIASIRCMRDLLPYQGKAGAMEKASAIYNAWFDAASARQDIFDKQTNHSNNLVEEKRWEALLSREFHTLETFPSKSHGRNR